MVKSKERGGRTKIARCSCSTDGKAIAVGGLHLSSFWILEREAYPACGIARLDGALQF